MEQRGPGAALGILAIGGLILLMTQQRRAEAAPPSDGALPGAGGQRSEEASRRCSWHRDFRRRSARPWRWSL